MPDQLDPPHSEPDVGLPGAPCDEGIARDLTGDLPCVNCRYNLRGLSIRLACPECGVPVLATILDVVDPHAQELQPIKHRRLVALGMVVWSVAAVLAVLAVWLVRSGDAAALIGWSRPSMAGVGAVAAGLLLLSGLGAVSLIAPHARIPLGHRLAAAGAVAAYLPLVSLVWWVLDRLDPATGFAYLTASPMPTQRIILRLGITVLTIAIIFGLRPNARTLAARSLVVREGRVDRQPMAALAWSLLIASAGDVVGLVLIGAPAELREIGIIVQTLLIGVGSALFTLGLVGIVLDTLRLMPVIVSPPLSYRDLVAMPEADHP